MSTNKLHVFRSSEGLFLFDTIIASYSLRQIKCGDWELYSEYRQGGQSLDYFNNLEDIEKNITSLKGLCVLIKNPITQEFVNYFNSFYGQSGMFSTNKTYTLSEIQGALVNLIKKSFNYEFEGDSFDRERIRDELISEGDYVNG